jgi:hypothetical protein
MVNRPAPELTLSLNTARTGKSAPAGFTQQRTFSFPYVSGR